MEVEEEEDVNLTNSNYQRMEQEKEIHHRSLVNGLREDYDDMTMKTDRSESSAAETAVIQDDQDEIVGDQPEVFRLTTKLRQHMSMADADEEDEVEEVDGQGDATKLDNYTTRSGSWVNGTSASLERKRVMAETGEGFGTLEKKDKHRTRDSSGLFGADGEGGRKAINLIIELTWNLFISRNVCVALLGDYRGQDDNGERCECKTEWRFNRKARGSSSRW